MIVIAGTITYDPQDEPGVRDAVQTVAAATRQEAGNRSYEFFADLTGPGRLLVFEEWDSDEALTAHFSAPHLLEFREALQRFSMKSREITRYVVSETSHV